MAGILAVASAGMLYTPAFATDYSWVVANGTWNNGPNWNPSGEPNTGDNALIGYPSGVCHVIGAVFEPANVSIYNLATLDLEHNALNEGFVETSADVYVGITTEFGDNAGTLNILGKPPLQNAGQGRLITDGDMFVTPDSTVNQSGGSVTISGSNFAQPSLYLQGIYNQSAGVFSTLDGDILHGGFNLSGTGAATFGGLTDEGLLLQTGGNLTVASIDGGFIVKENYVLQGGTLTCGSMTLNQSTSSVSYRGGSLSTGPLSISSHGQVSLSSGGGKVLRSTSISIDVVNTTSYQGGVDLSDNAMIVDYTGNSPLASISSMIRNGTYASGVITGITSSTAVANVSSHKTALGYGEASTLGVSSFKGQSVDSTSVLIAYTWLGDANLDGKVNALDFNMLASNFGKTPGSDVWTQGDFNSDGKVDTQDFAFLSTNFNQPALSSAALGTAAPEPRILAFPMLIGLWMHRRLQGCISGRRRMRICP